MFERIEQLDAESRADLSAVSSVDDLEVFRIKYLGAKGAVKRLMAGLKQVAPADKPRFGQQANALRKKLQSAFDVKKAQLDAVWSDAGDDAATLLDVTEPGTGSRLGRTHVITQTIDELIDVFGRMGFDVATGPEVEDEYHNFVALNIPMQHPARDPLDNFYIRAGGAAAGGDVGNRSREKSGGDPPAEPGATSGAGGGAYLLRSQTSTVQIRVMEQTPPPIRVISLGRVYRPDEHDATHYSMFHQIEGLYVDKNVSMIDLKTTLIQFAHAYFGPEAEIRLRPSYFPFTEPSAELDIKMKVKDTWDWVELGGCGMVDPAVFEAVGYDPEQWTGFAFGLGIERVTMRKYGISDIRWLFENDVRFLRQF